MENEKLKALLAEQARETETLAGMRIFVKCRDKDIEKILHIGKTKAYMLLDSDGFPCMLELTVI